MTLQVCNATINISDTQSLTPEAADGAATVA